MITAREAQEIGREELLKDVLKSQKIEAALRRLLRVSQTVFEPCSYMILRDAIRQAQQALEE